jgi:thiol-disulfide isomerase/thioredoxin
MHKLFFACLLIAPLSMCAQSISTNPKAQKNYAEGQQYLKQHQYSWALDYFKKAAKEDPACAICQQEILDVGLDVGDTKAALAAGEALVGLVHNPKDMATAHYLYGGALLRAGSAKHDQELLTKSSAEFKAASEADPQLHAAIFGDAMALATAGHDDQAKQRFTEYLKVADPSKVEYKRAQRYLERPELARARMAPPFHIKTIDGRDVAFDDLAGKVVLIDFWATWCGPCREALPRIREIAHKFQDQPLVVMSISLDSDDAKWRDFVAKNGMTWIQGRDNGFDGKVATTFAVHAIPATFTIDADGVLQDQHVGDAAIEGKLKKLIANAQAMRNQENAQTHAGGGS